MRRWCGCAEGCTHAPDAHPGRIWCAKCGGEGVWLPRDRELTPEQRRELEETGTMLVSPHDIEVP